MTKDLWSLSSQTFLVILVLISRSSFRRLKKNMFMKVFSGGVISICWINSLIWAIITLRKNISFKTAVCIGLNYSSTHTVNLKDCNLCYWDFWAQQIQNIWIIDKIGLQIFRLNKIIKRNLHFTKIKTQEHWLYLNMFTCTAAITLLNNHHFLLYLNQGLFLY